MRAIFLLFLAMILSSCSEKAGFEKDFDRTNQVMQIRVIFHDSPITLQKAKESVDGAIEPNLRGFAGWNRENNYCEIHSLRPKTIDDDKTLTLGHELLHCIHGSYHK